MDKIVKVIIDEKIPYIKEVFEKYGEVTYKAGVKITEEDLLDKDILITRTRTRCDSSTLKNSRIKIIASATIGTDHIDIDYCKKKGITVFNAPGCNAESVNQYVLSALSQLSINHNIKLKDKRIAIIGVGNIGKRLDLSCQLLNMKVTLCDPPRDRTDPNFSGESYIKAISSADIITYHVPLIKAGIDKTVDLFNHNIIPHLKKGVVIINSCRGEVINDSAMIKALDSKVVSHAIIDCWNGEPNINKDLLSKVTFGTPHIAGYSIDGKFTATRMVSEQILSLMQVDQHNWNNITVPSVNRSKQELSTDDDETKVCLEILHTYNIESDHNTLINNSVNFEKHRNNYPIRREFGAFSPSKVDLGEKVSTTLKKLGFNII